MDTKNHSAGHVPVHTKIH